MLGFFYLNAGFSLLSYFAGLLFLCIGAGEHEWHLYIVHYYYYYFKMDYDVWNSLNV